MSDPREVNRQLWNEWTEEHVRSEFYDVPGFLAGRESLGKMELEALGDVRGKRLLHLQCHFGMDTLSLARKGAVVTGVDFSPEGMWRTPAGYPDLPLTFTLKARRGDSEVLSEAGSA